MKSFFSELHTFHIPKMLSLILFFVPFLHIITALFVQISLVNAAPPGQKYDQLAGRGLYVNIIMQGTEGHWTTSLPFTTEIQPRVFGYNFFFIVLGQVNRLFHFDSLILFQVSMILTGIFLLVSTYWMLRQLFPPGLAILSYFFIHFIETGVYFPSLLLGKDHWEPSFVLQQILIERHFGLPHHTFGKAVGLLFLGSFLKYCERPSIKWLLMTLSTSFITAFFLPPIIFVMFITVIAPYMVFQLFKKNLRPVILPFVLSSGIVAGTASFLKAQLAVVPALAIYSEREKTWWTNSDTLLRYASSFMFYYPFFLIALFVIGFYWKTFSSKTKQFTLLLISWLVVPALLIPISSQSFFPMANARLVDGYQYFPAGVLAAVGIAFLLTKVRFGWIKHLSIFTTIGVIVFSTCTSLILTNQHIKMHSSGWWNIYPAMDFWKSLDFIKTLPKESNILMENLLAEVVPSYALVNVYVAAPGATWPFFDARKEKMMMFYQGKMSEEEAKKFIIDNHIDYIYYGVGESLITQTVTLYSNLFETVYQSDNVVIFKMKKT